MPEEGPSQRFQSLPSVRALLDEPSVRELIETHSRALVTEAARLAVEEARQRLKRGEAARVGPEEVSAALGRLIAPRLVRVINATGVVLHTNLGRAPLAPEAIARAVEASRGYANLEIVLERGERGGRDEGVDRHLRALVGCEQAFAVNNGAAAALLALSAIASGREVIVSRGELVEIGGGFRVPEVLEQSGCKLVEVGTTNRTRVSDVKSAIRPETGAILKVHRSNFAIVGFTSEASIAELSPLAREAGVPLVYDQGTGELDAVRRAIADGADVVVFSGDKLLGGPQAGLVAGRAALVERIRRHPLARALRIDRLRLAALEETLALWRRDGAKHVPTARMLAEDPVETRRRAERLLARVSSTSPVRVVPSEGAAGGGTRPAERIESYAVEVRVERAHVLARFLRTGSRPVVARVVDGAVLLDAKTIAPDEVEEAARALNEALARHAQAPVSEAREADGPPGVFWEADEAP